MKKFTQRVNKILENKSVYDLKVLLEEDETENKEEDSIEDEDLIGTSSSDSDEDTSESKDDGEGEEEGEEGEKDEEEEKADGVTKAQFDNLNKELSVIKNVILQTKEDDGTGSLESYFVDAASTIQTDDSSEEVSDGLKEYSSYKNKSLMNFLLKEEEVNPEEVEADIEVLDAVLSKGIDLVDKFKKGTDVDIDSYATAAINAYKNFDNLFSKEKIVKQAATNVLVLISGAKAEQNIKEFEEKFYEELSKKHGVEYEDQVLVTKNFNTGVGAKSQG